VVGGVPVDLITELEQHITDQALEDLRAVGHFNHTGVSVNVDGLDTFELG
jgi:hypothetical protein